MDKIDIMTPVEDQEIARILAIMKANRLQVRVRKSIMFIDKLTKREIGGSEFKRRINNETR